MIKSNHLEPVPHLNMSWILVEIAILLRTIEHVISRHRTATYQMAMELRYDDHGIDAIIPVHTGQWIMNPLDEDNPRTGSPIESSPIFLGPFKVPDQIDWSTFLAARLDDLFDLSGRESPFPNISFEF